MTTAPPPAPTQPGLAAEGEPASAPMVAPAGPEFGPSAAPAAPAPGGCTCGDRRGLSRWRYHRTHCKRHLQDKFLGYAEEFNEWPLGEAAYAHARTQVANGQAARMVFYHYDFVDGTPQLNTRGRDKLAAVAATLPTNFFPIVVERTPKEPGLDESRRQIVVAALARGSFPIPAERVMIGPSHPEGLSGIEGLAIFGNQLGGIQSGGALGGGVAGIGAFVGGAGTLDAGGLSGGVTAPAPR